MKKLKTMKNLKYKILGILCVLFLFGSCSEDILNVSPTDQMSDETVWQDPALIDLYLADIYRRMHHGIDEVKLSSLTDDTHFIHGYGTIEIVQGIASPSNVGAWGRGDLRHFRWDHLYSAIRQTNIVLANIDDANVTEEFRNNVKGETHFLRAYFYHNLVRNYGGIPIITQVYNLDDDLLVPRNSFEESVNFVVEEADRAAALLPVEARDLGRATKGAALTLKARILIHAASDLYADPIGSTPEVTGYTSGSQEARYQAAKDAAQAVMDMGVYSLFERVQGDPATNYEQLFIVNEDHEETIMARFFLGSRDWQDRFLPHQFNGPNGYRGWAGNTPLQSLVDAYEMADGTQFDWNNQAHASDPFANRDPRFYASILYDGAPWVTPPSFREPYDVDGHIQTFERVTLPDNSQVVGVDTRNGPIEDWNGSYSRYYLRKFIDPTLPPQERAETPWIYMRYAEVILNYAEACIGLGEEQNARDAMNMIRARAGMPDITDSGQALIDRYQNERRVELFGEEHRLFDIRRWKTAPTKYEDARGILITAEATDARDRSTYSNYTFDPTLHIQDRAWDDSHYFAPIPFDEINRNDQLVQNPGY
ncbi:RagB/SusD family nutrient uptake outer membrane protein [Aliifodinibius sp. S!AR15-10]|uniref:RagB/SusD family nutrient uptake outer membrane protein n=1 Tax=Aliifodinibius sp. S!AR15-10 TaxID=2950437 RepID=UPI00286085A7|nr:RagB/SusD family nutrient uptake outer membrane protein [Aliifodinibius sp. S!AR15-10]MDR8392544.1 RagB/SusD family nutrient uptake outer membrane protein [Aliifodinibius sp. S!AR15-10]